LTKDHPEYSTKECEDHSDAHEVCLAQTALERVVHSVSAAEVEA